MGLSPFSGLRCSACPTASAPDPARFELFDVIEVGKHVVALIRYPDCKNFEGNKICLYKDTDRKTLRGRRVLDPHFSEDDLAPFARFEPTTEGLAAAIKLAEIL